MEDNNTNNNDDNTTTNNDTHPTQPVEGQRTTSDQPVVLVAHRNHQQAPAGPSGVVDGAPPRGVEGTRATADSRGVRHLEVRLPAQKKQHDSTEFPETPRDVFQRVNKSKQLGELSFILGTCNTHLNVFLFAAYPTALVIFYSLKLPLLVLLRLITYYKTYSHYFLLDPCYFANAFFLITLWLLGGEDQSRGLMVAFGIVNGPIAWAVVVFRNSLVFHSVDKLTSLIIHLTPAMVSHVVRFRLQDDFSVCETDTNSNHKFHSSCDSVGEVFTYCVGYGMVFFVAHQFFYYVLIQLCCMTFNKEFASGKDRRGKSAYWTSFRYLTHDRKSLLSKIIFSLGPKLSPFVFFALNASFAAISMCFTVLLYHYRWVHFAFLVFLFVVSSRNGSTFYYEVFAEGKGRDIF